MNQHSRDAIAYLNTICPNEDFYLHFDGQKICNDLSSASTQQRLMFLAAANVIRLHPETTNHTSMLRVSDDLTSLHETAEKEPRRRLDLLNSQQTMNAILKPIGVSVLFDGQFLSAQFQPSEKKGRDLTGVIMSLMYAKEIGNFDLDLNRGTLSILSVDQKELQAFADKNGFTATAIDLSQIGDRTIPATTYQPRT
jgi:hypothetical protein